MSNDEQWLTISETAERLGVSLRQCYRLVELGKLPTTKFGRRQMVHVSDIDKLATELGIAHRPSKPKEDRRVEVVQQSEGEIAQMIRSLQDELRIAYLTIGELRADLKMRLLPDEERAIRQQTTELEIHAKQLEGQIKALQRQSRWRLLLAVIIIIVLILAIGYLSFIR
jgi:excisionase family DNA binding protein